MKFHELTAPRIRALEKPSVLVLVPIAAVEQHGPHLPTGTDTIICTAIAERIEQRFPHRVLLVPTVWLGASAHHLRFGATLSAELESFIHTLKDIGRSLLDQGFRRLLFLNGHGGNVDPLHVALRVLNAECPEALLAGGSYWSVAAKVIASLLEGEHKDVGHACELETSLIMHLRPELVDGERVRDAGYLVPNVIDGLFVARDMRQRTREGATGRPDLASAEKGRRLFDGIVEALAATVERLLTEPLGTEYSDFVPAGSE
ncbi:MAG: creatininase family protein [Planctomycetota bacterium]|nr:MAG: creatininase family protein [Planctomycetota bacterium]